MACFNNDDIDDTELLDTTLAENAELKKRVDELERWLDAARTENASWRDQYTRLQAMHVELNTRACRAEEAKEAAGVMLKQVYDKAMAEIADVNAALEVAVADAAYWKAKFGSRVEVTEAEVVP